MLCKKTSKNQLTLPREIVKSFPDAEYFDISVKGSQIVLVPVKITKADATLEAVRDKMQRLGINDADVSEALGWARKRKPRA